MQYSSNTYTAAALSKLSNLLGTVVLPPFLGDASEVVSNASRVELEAIWGVSMLSIGWLLLSSSSVSNVGFEPYICGISSSGAEFHCRIRILASSSAYVVTKIIELSARST